MRARIVAAGGDDDVAVLAVTKGFGTGCDRLPRPLAGCTAIGENYVQELLAKPTRSRPPVSACTSSASCRPTRCASWRAGELCTRLSTGSRLAAEIAERDPGAAVLIQVDTSGEAGKGGCPLDDLDRLVDECAHAGSTCVD